MHQVRSRIDIIEVEIKEGRVVHWEKLIAVAASINLVPWAPFRGYLIRIPGDSIFPA